MSSADANPGDDGQTGRDKRRSPRFVVEALQGTMMMASPVEVLNLSLGGVAVRASRRLNLGCEYTLKLQVEDHVLPLKGVVVWAVLSGSHREQGEVVPLYSAGLRFTDLMTERLRDIIGFIDENKVAEEQRLLGLRLVIRAPGGKATLDSPEEYRVKLISLYGMLIEADHSLAAGVVVSMSITPPLQAPIEFTARVVSCQPAESGRQAIGMEFREMTDEGRGRLARYIESLSGH